MYKGILLLLFLTLVLLYVIKVYSYTVPKMIWCHWDGETLPPLIDAIHQRNRRVLKDWEFRRLTTAQFLQMCPRDELPRGFDQLIVQHKADFMRLWLLQKYGGVWMDISTVVNESLNLLLEYCVKERADLAGFYIESSNTDSRYPVFENWFIMAPCRSHMIRLWYEEYCKAFSMGLLNYKQKLRDSGLVFHKLSGEDDSVYFTQHYAFQALLQRGEVRNVLMWRAEDSMFKLQKSCWNDEDKEKGKKCFESLFTAEKVRSVPWIKLTGNCRQFFTMESLPSD